MIEPRAGCAPSTELRRQKRMRRLLEVAPHLTEDQWGHTLKAVRDIRDLALCSTFLRTTASTVPTLYLGEGLVAAISLLEGGYLEPVEAILPRVSESQLAQIFIRALAMADEDNRVRILLRLAPRLTEEQKWQILRTILTIDDVQKRMRRLVEIAPHLTEDQWGHVFTVERGFRNTSVLGDILEAIVSSIPAPCMGDAFSYTSDIPTNSTRIRALRALAPRLTEEQLRQTLVIYRQAIDESYLFSVLIPPQERYLPRFSSAVICEYGIAG
jgi:hypothetical protein